MISNSVHSVDICDSRFANFVNKKVNRMALVHCNCDKDLKSGIPQQLRMVVFTSIME